MATLLPRSALQVARRQTVCATSIAVQTCHSSNQPRIIKNPTLAALKKGTGGRSSFNGIVCTVFGASGFVGKYLCNTLCKTGTQVIVPYRADHYSMLPMKLSADLGQLVYQEIDLADDEAIYKCIKYSNVVVNLIGRDFDTKNYLIKQVNVDAARRIARICKEAGNVEHFVHVSCLNADPHPTPLVLTRPSTILTTKWDGECAVREEFPEATIVRPSDIYGQGDRFLRCYTHFKWRHFSHIPVYAKGLKTEKQPVYVGDVARGIAEIIYQNHKTMGKTYQFVGPQRYLFSDLIRWWIRVLFPDSSIPELVTADINKSFLFWPKVYMLEHFTLTTPTSHLHWQKIEKDSHSDKIQKEIPRLEDLGITPAQMADRIEWELQPFRHYFDVPIRTSDVISVSPPNALTAQ